MPVFQANFIVAELSNRDGPPLVYPRTAEGIGPGSTVEELLATYPDATPVEHTMGGVGAYTIVQDTVQIAFEVHRPGGRVTRVGVGASEGVDYFLASQWCTS